jgi:DNA mismatch repair protein MutL
VHLFIEMPHDAVDVNVHPTKAEVRFRDQSYIHELFAGRSATRSAAARPRAPARSAARSPRSRPRCRCPTHTPIVPSRWSAAAARRTAATASSHRRATPIAPTGEERVAPTIRPMMPLGQFRDTFIIAVDDEGIAIIDQHVAHERVLSSASPSG